MSANPEIGAPTPDTLEDAFSALDTAPELVDQHGQPLPFTNAAPAGQPAEVAPQGREAAPPDANEQQPGESDIDYKARAADLERQIANREWSSQGRYLQEKAKREALEARIRQLEEGYQSEDQYRASLYDNAIANAKQAGDTSLESLLTRERDLELRTRADDRQRAAAAAQQQVAQAEQQTTQQLAQQYATQVVRTEAFSAIEQEIDRLAQRYDLPQEEATALRQGLRTPYNQMVVETAPAKFVGAWSLQLLEALEAQAQAAQARVVAGNREQASAQGTYRGPVNTAVAPPQPVRGRDVTKSSTEDLADAFFSDLSPTG